MSSEARRSTRLAPVLVASAAAVAFIAAMASSVFRPIEPGLSWAPLLFFWNGVFLLGVAAYIVGLVLSIRAIIRGGRDRRIGLVGAGILLVTAALVGVFTLAN